MRFIYNNYRSDYLIKQGVNTEPWFMKRKIQWYCQLETWFHISNKNNILRNNLQRECTRGNITLGRTKTTFMTLINVLFVNILHQSSLKKYTSF